MLFSIYFVLLQGDLVFLKMFGTPAIVVNSVEVAHDLLVKRGAIYSERPRLTMLNDMSVFLLLPVRRYNGQC